ncbi:MAG TPA: methylated-DNA--[protein]-cysteine S-methyltransferase [Alloprevotella sp.]|nr:methylated-DNA--[protein]-cysteine S-methyltransferase [Alloprevotella sp.]
MKERNVVLTRLYQSPCGVLMLGSFGDQLCLCDWQVEKRHVCVNRRLQKMLRAGFTEGTSEVMEKAVLQLDEFFVGKRREFDVPLLFAGTGFQQRVWDELLKIPFGETVSYGEMARRIGMPAAVRAVANANGANALSVFVPCHRVIGGDSLLRGYGGGVDTKRKLLELEGVAFSELKRGWCLDKTEGGVWTKRIEGK